MGEPERWVRPVSDREHGEVSERERQFQGGIEPRVLDLVYMPALQHSPQGFQTENWLLDTQYYWRKYGAFPRSDLTRLVDNRGRRLWINGNSTFHGKNDRVSEDDTRHLSNSLRLIRVDRLTLSVFVPGKAFGNDQRRVQGTFAHLGEVYTLRLTDPIYERGYLAKSDGQYQIGECYLTISLGEPYNGWCYKLIAAIIE